MAQSRSKKIAEVEKKNRQQQEELHNYKKREMWIKRAGVAVLALVILLFLLMGLTNDWWRGAKDSSVHQFAPTSATGPGPQNTATPETTTSTTTITPPSTTETGTNSTSTTNNSTNTSTTTTTNNNPGEPTSPTLLEVVQSVANGQTLDDVLARAQTGGAQVSCHNELLVFRVCTITSGDDSVTIKALNSGEVIDVNSTF